MKEEVREKLLKKMDEQMVVEEGRERELFLPVKYNQEKQKMGAPFPSFILFFILIFHFLSPKGANK